MDFALSDIQTQFKASIRRFVADRSVQVDPHDRGAQWRKQHWLALADLGICAAMLPEAFGGLGGDAVDAMIIMEELGRGLAAAPYIERSVVGAGLIAGLGSAAQKEAWLPQLADGCLDLGIAAGSVCGGSGLIRLMRDGDAFRIDGQQDVVTAGDGLDLLLIAASSNGSFSLFATAPDRPGLTVRCYRTIDDRPASTVKFEGLRVDQSDLIGPEGAAGDIISRVYDVATVAHCGEAMGVMASLLNATIAHLKTRQQFGQPLAQFQALQHRLADMYLDYEMAVSSIYKAAILARDASAPQRSRAVSAAKVLTAQAARRIGHEAIQMHGAMGMTAELPVGYAVKRLKATEAQYGTPAFHLRRYRAIGST